MNIYEVHGTRHRAIIFAHTPAEAVAQALERGVVGDWEYPEAIEVPLPKGYRLIYDPLVGGMEQAALPLSFEDVPLEPAHTLTRSGVKVYDDWHDNIIVDADAPPLAWKAGRDLFGTNTGVPGRPRLASENSEDALSWNLFRTLEKAGRLEVLARALGLEDEFEVLYWYRPWHSADPLPEIVQALQQVEPRKGYQTETDIILRGKRYLVMVESKLGKPGLQLRSWAHAGSLSVSASYEAPLRTLLAVPTDWQKTMLRFYQLLRHLVVAQALSRPERWGLEPHLLAIVNGLNRYAGLRTHAQEFAAFQSSLNLPVRQTHLLTWQQLFARAEATFDPAIQPLLAHTARLSYLREPVPSNRLRF